MSNKLESSYLIDEAMHRVNRADVFDRTTTTKIALCFEGYSTAAVHEKLKKLRSAKTILFELDFCKETRYEIIAVLELLNAASTLEINNFEDVTYELVVVKKPSLFRKILQFFQRAKTTKAVSINS